LSRCGDEQGEGILRGGKRELQELQFIGNQRKVKNNEKENRKQVGDVKIEASNCS
jgi:hypothetical protein